MAFDEAPPFWWRRPGWQAILLSPAGWIWGNISGRRMFAGTPEKVNAPVICVGNFITGGGGKTPTVRMIAAHAKKAGHKPGVLSRGFGGAITNATLVDLERHNAHDVGDEALLHAGVCKTVVSADRPTGAALLLEQGCDLIIMDDGFQNPSLHKDYSLVVADGRRGLGNGFCIPAGPMRAPLATQLLKANAVLVIGAGRRGEKIFRRAARAGKPAFAATSSLGKASRKISEQVLAFAGIANPDAFFAMLESDGVTVSDRQGFGDHHVYTEEECLDLLARAEKEKLGIVTTEKDAVRLAGSGEVQSRLVGFSKVLPLELVPDDPNMLDRILADTLHRYDQRRLSSLTLPQGQ